MPTFFSDVYSFFLVIMVAKLIFKLNELIILQVWRSFREISVMSCPKALAFSRNRQTGQVFFIYLLEIFFKMCIDIVVDQHVYALWVYYACKVEWRAPHCLDPINAISYWNPSIILQFAWISRQRYFSFFFFFWVATNDYQSLLLWRGNLLSQYICFLCTAKQISHNWANAREISNGCCQTYRSCHTGLPIMPHNNFVIFLTCFWTITRFISHIIAGRCTWGICITDTQFHIS